MNGKIHPKDGLQNPTNSLVENVEENIIIEDDNYHKFKKKTYLRRVLENFVVKMVYTFKVGQRRKKHFEKRFREIIIEDQTNDHLNVEYLFKYVKEGDIDKVSSTKRLDLIEMRDSAGANLVHVAYLYKKYDIGRYLICEYPHLGLQSYSSTIKLGSYKRIVAEIGKVENLNSYMPYTGENILHIAIMQRNYEEVRWILHFYQQRGGIKQLLTSETIGKFFYSTDSFYFGGYPLAFAACSNNVEIFDLILSFSSTTPTLLKVKDTERNSTGTYVEIEKITESNNSSRNNITRAKSNSFVKVGGVLYSSSKDQAPYIMSDLSTSVENNNNNGNGTRHDLGLRIDTGGDPSVRTELENIENNDTINNNNAISTTVKSCVLQENVIFLRDTFGNNILHLCVIHCLQDMYQHVYKRAEEVIQRELKEAYSKHEFDFSEEWRCQHRRLYDEVKKERAAGKAVRRSSNTNKSQVVQFFSGGGGSSKSNRHVQLTLAPLSSSSPRRRHSHDDEMKESFTNHDDVNDTEDAIIEKEAEKRINVDMEIKLSPYNTTSKFGYVIRPSKIYMPAAHHYKEWLRAETNILMDERLVLALNNEFLSPLTLAAHQIKKIDYYSSSKDINITIENRDKKIANRGTHVVGDKKFDENSINNRNKNIKLPQADEMDTKTIKILETVIDDSDALNNIDILNKKILLDALVIRSHSSPKLNIDKKIKLLHEIIKKMDEFEQKMVKESDIEHAIDRKLNSAPIVDKVIEFYSKPLTEKDEKMKIARLFNVSTKDVGGEYLENVEILDKIQFIVNKIMKRCEDEKNVNAESHKATRDPNKIQFYVSNDSTSNNNNNTLKNETLGVHAIYVKRLSLIKALLRKQMVERENVTYDQHAVNTFLSSIIDKAMDCYDVIDKTQLTASLTSKQAIVSVDIFYKKVSVLEAILEFTVSNKHFYDETRHFTEKLINKVNLVDSNIEKINAAYSEIDTKKEEIKLENNYDRIFTLLEKIFGNVNKLTDAENRKVEMLEFLLGHLKTKLWDYGPVDYRLMNLKGVEVQYDNLLYANLPMDAIANIHGAIEWLCIHDAEHAIRIPEIQRFIELKWKRIGSPTFIASFILNLFVTIMITLILIFINATPADPDLASEWIVNFIYPLLIFIFLFAFVQETQELLQYNAKYFKFRGRFLQPIDQKVRQEKRRIHIFAMVYSSEEDKVHQRNSSEQEIIMEKIEPKWKQCMQCFKEAIYDIRVFLDPAVDYCVYNWNYLFQLRGAVRFDKWCRLFKVYSFIIFCVMKLRILLANRANHYEPSDDDKQYIVHDYVGVKVALAICVIACWLHLFYFLMGFDLTGRFILTIFRIVSRDVPYFLRFYMIVVIAFGCALSVLSNSGNYHPYYGFWHLVQAIWTLIQDTVNIEPTHNVIAFELVPNDLRWLSDILLTFYYMLVVLIMLNLLIAMISSTFSQYTSYNHAILLMEKYNIMKDMERAMTDEEIEYHREKYTTVKVYDKKKGISRKLRHDITGENITTADSHSNNNDSINSGNNRIDCSSVDNFFTSFFHRYFKCHQVIDENDKRYEKQFLFELYSVTTDWWSQDDMMNNNKVLKLQCSSGKTLSLSATKTNKMKDIENYTTINLFIVDPQIDFHPAYHTEDGLFQHDGGSLPVPGANEDSKRVAKMILDNVYNITNIFVSMDTHKREHIAHSNCWIRRDTLKHPTPFTRITFKDIESGEWISIQGQTNFNKTIFEFIMNEKAFDISYDDLIKMNETSFANYLISSPLYSELYHRKMIMEEPLNNGNAVNPKFICEIQALNEYISMLKANEFNKNTANIDSLLEELKELLKMTNEKRDNEKISSSSISPGSTKLRSDADKIRKAYKQLSDKLVTLAMLVILLKRRDKLSTLEEFTKCGVLLRSNLKRDKRWVTKYTFELEKKGKLVLTIWPDHCIMGTRGHDVVPIISHALSEWENKNNRKVKYILKGENIRTEFYSALEAEVEDPLDVNTSLNRSLMSELKMSDRLLVCGEALSHCVNYTLRDIMRHWHKDLSNIYLLENGSSPVVAFEGEANELVNFARDSGVTVTTVNKAFL